MSPRQPKASLVALLFLGVACTSGGGPGPTRTTPSSPHAGPPLAVSGASPFRGCSTGGEISTDSEVEPSLVVDQASSQRLLAAWQQDRNARGGALGIALAASADGGATWRPGGLPRITRCAGGPYDLASDPVVSIGAGGLAYLGAIAFDVVGSGKATRFDTDVVVSTSSDGGLTWGDPVPLATTEDPLVSFDKESVLAGRKVPGAAYAVWVQYTQPRPGATPSVDETFFSRTADGGRTWSPPAHIYGSETETQFHQLVELPDGSLLDAFVEARTLSGRAPFSAHLSVIRSTDGGLTWSSPVDAAEVTFTNPVDPSGKDHIRATGQGVMAAAGADGDVYLGWAEDHPQGESFVAVERSDDGGLTWSSPMTVAKGPGQPFIPSVAVAGDGTVGVSWYEVAAWGTPGASPSPLGSEVRFAWSTDRGKTWRAVDVAGPFDLRTANLSAEGNFVGDYDGLVGLPRGFGALFALAGPLSRVGPTDVFFSEIELA